MKLSDIQIALEAISDSDLERLIRIFEAASGNDASESIRVTMPSTEWKVACDMLCNLQSLKEDTEEIENDWESETVDNATIERKS